MVVVGSVVVVVGGGGGGGGVHVDPAGTEKLILLHFHWDEVGFFSSAMSLSSTDWMLTSIFVFRAQVCVTEAYP